MLNLPFWQRVQTAAPGVKVNEPATHVVHVSEVAEPSVLLADPAAHSWQSAELVEPSAKLKLPVEQSVHAEVPSALAYEPALQAVQTRAPDSLDIPAPQSWQSAKPGVGL